MKKLLFIYWGQEFDNAPFVVKKCLLSWKINNPTWKIVELNNTNLNTFINIEQEIPNLKNKNVSSASFSDIIRIFILFRYGGCWCDATTFCNMPLDSWLYEYTSTGFFGFQKPKHAKHKIASWFLYAKKGNYLIKKWKEYTIKYWKERDSIDDYFWFHILFDKLYHQSKRFKNIWDCTKKMSREGPHLLFNHGYMNLVSDEIKHNIINKKEPLYKLTHKYCPEHYSDECNMGFLLNYYNLKFIHIPKAAGTSIEEAALKKNILWGKYDEELKNFQNISKWHTPQIINRYSFCVIRDPVDRLISQFYHCCDVVYYNSKYLNIFIETIIPKIQQNINYIDNHLLPQADFYKCCNIAICFDNLQQNITQLMKLFEMPYLELPNLPGGIDQQNKRKNISINKLNYSDISIENMKIIQDFYKEDFELYNLIKEKKIVFHDLSSNFSLHSTSN